MTRKPFYGREDRNERRIRLTSADTSPHTVHGQQSRGAAGQSSELLLKSSEIGRPSLSIWDTVVNL
jgi:hypothetical protein